MSTGRVLAVLAKAPHPGAVKTRLVPFLDPEEAALLQEAMLADLLEAPWPRGVRRVLHLGGVHERIQVLAGGCGWEIEPQGEGGLGERMLAVFERHRSAVTVLLGADVPGLGPGPWLEKAFENAGQGRAVFGPAEDGGYWTVALDGPVKALFEGVPWSTPEVLKTTLDRAAAAGVPVHLVETRNDVDNIADVERLWQEQTGAPGSAARTRELVGALLRRVPMRERRMRRAGR